MEPVLHENERVIVSCIPYLFMQPKRGDLVIFKHPKTGKLSVKRVIRRSGTDYFLAGENKADSSDSRSFGLITISAILAKVVCILHVQ